MSGKKRPYQSKLTGGNLLLKKPKPEENVVCPICEIEIKSSLIHLHVDGCLQRVTAREKQNEEIGNHVCENQCGTTESTGTSIGSNDAPEDMRMVEMTEVPGLWLIYNFISEEEEASIVRSLDEDSDTPWRFSSFNGNCNSKSFGVKTQFGLPGEERCVRRNNPAAGEHDIPNYLHAFPVRLQNIIQQALHPHHGNDRDSSHTQSPALCLNSLPCKLPPPEVVKFVPNECNANSYESSSRHYLRAHFDDRTLSGPILVNLSLNCDSRMTYHLATPVSGSMQDTIEQEFSINLPRRTLQLVTGPARWKYRHSIKAEDVLGSRRVSVTWRKSQSKTAGIRNKVNVV